MRSRPAFPTHASILLGSARPQLEKLPKLLLHLNAVFEVITTAPNFSAFILRLGHRPWLILWEGMCVLDIGTAADKPEGILGPKPRCCFLHLAARRRIPFIPPCLPSVARNAGFLLEPIKPAGRIFWGEKERRCCSGAPRLSGETEVKRILAALILAWPMVCSAEDVAINISAVPLAQFV